MILVLIDHIFYVLVLKTCPKCNLSFQNFSALFLGVIQSTTNTTGSSIVAVVSVGNFQTLQLQTEVGVWELRMMSTNPYTLKVIGEIIEQ